MILNGQATTLKRITCGNMNEPGLRVLAVSSGKGGVGKTNIVANFAYALSKRGKKVLVVDADLGLNNIDILLGLASGKHIGHVLFGESNIEDIILQGPEGIHVLPAGDGLQELTQLETEKKMVLIDELDRISGGYDYLIFDTGAGISPNVTFFCSAAHETILVATTEPTSLTDVYALVKILNNSHSQKHFRLIVNSVASEREAHGVYRNLADVADRFLKGVSVEYLGYVLQDPNVSKAIRQQKAFLEIYPFSQFSGCINDLAEKISKEKPKSVSGEANQSYFWRSAFQAQ